MSYEKELKHFLGHSLYSWQIEIVELLRQGHNIILSAPTGAGKTAVYQAAIKLYRDMYGDKCLPVVVISPLRALLADQARRMEELGVTYV